MLLYYITDRTQFPGTESGRWERLLNKIAEAALGGVDFVQLREKDLSARDLKLLARNAMARIRESGSRTRLLINSRTDVALAAGAEGVHLRADDISPENVRKIWRESGGAGNPVIAVSCHCDAEVEAAEESNVDFVVFGPVFEKNLGPKTKGVGLDDLHRVCRHKIPVFALGGITLENARLCAEAGAKGIAGIRLFQENNIGEIVAKLHG